MNVDTSKLYIYDFITIFFYFNIYFFSFSRKLLSELITSKVRSKDKDEHKKVNITGSSL